ncbi:MAG: GumC family protein [Mariniblastus sp.]
MNNNPLTIAQILSALKRHKFKAFAAWFLVMALIVAVFLAWPRKFGSEGRLYVQMGRNNTGISPSTGSASISIQDTRETEIRSVLEIIKSRAVLERVVKDIGAKEILTSRWDGWVPSISFPNIFSNGSADGGMSVEEYNRLKEEEYAAKKLEDSMVVHSEKKTSVISVFVKASSAKLAQRIVNSIFEHSRDVHLKVHASEGSAVFFDDQFDSQEKELVKSINALADFRNKNQFLSVGAARDTLQGIVSTIENDLLTTGVALEENKQRLTKLQELMAGTSAQIAMPKTGVERLSTEDSRTEVFKLESEVKRLSSTYSERHPSVVQAKVQLAALRQSLSSMATDRTESAMVSNPIYEALKVDLMRAEGDKAASEARLAALKNKQQESLDKLAQMNSAEVEADQLQRNVEVARQYLAIYTQKRGESKAMSLLDDLNISDVVVAQEANFVVKHVSPKGSLILPLGFICGLLAALATALFFDRNHLSATLNEGEVEQVLDLPVLVTLPRVYSSRNMVN